MNRFSGIRRVVGIVAVSAVAVWALAAGRDVSTRLQIEPGTPSAKAPVRFAAPAGAGSWLWSFGDGASSTDQNPLHVYAQPGTYRVTLQAGSESSSKVVEVVEAATLRLLSATGHPFDITLHARDPRTGAEGDGEAVPQNDVFGYFTIPALVPIAPGAPVVPEVFVKMLDARAIAGQDFWLFWGGLTDLEYTLTVTDTVRGTVKSKFNPARPPGQPANDCLGADTSGFVGEGGTPTPTPTVSAPPATPTPTPTPPGGSTRTVHVGDIFFRDASSNNNTTTISVGTKVQWEWEGSLPHTTTSGNCCTPNGMWNSGTKTSGSFDFTFNTAGNFPYFCQVHGAMMTGTVIVNP
jgi:plastocyanin